MRRLSLIFSLVTALSVFAVGAFGTENNGFVESPVSQVNVFVGTEKAEHTFPGAYVIGSPLFERAEVAMAGGGKLVIAAKNVSSKNLYVQSAELNGSPLDRPWISHAEIANGGELVFVMGPDKNPDWGSAPGDAPPSFEGLISLYDSAGSR